ncbi:MAG TPA: hypothetical protein ENG83_15385 [Nitrospirae bacterium]|nr:O-Antigen ligase [bacterium BMS3Abin06]HDH13552.1 hypothetical protein [Nitrospirota bacterium]HDZ01008.1 hypothetical protein [Nitrospirota bacterium]
MNKNGQTSLVIVIALLFLVAVALLNIFKIPPQFPVIFLLAVTIFIIAFTNTDAALVILIFSMLLSPELPVGGIRGRAVVLRMDDIFLFVVFLGWLAKMAVNKELALSRVTSLNRPILFYILICLLATGLGILQGYTGYKESFFYLLKYFEYFLLFFMVSNNIKNIRQVRMFTFFILLTCFLVSAYAWQLHLTGVTRVAAPFDGIESGEANTLAGYLLLMIAIVMGLILYSNSVRQRIALLGLLCFMVPPFIFTLSRGAWLGFIPMYISMIILTKKKARHILLICLLIIIVLSPILFPESVYDRISSTFAQGGEVYTVFGRQITFAESGAARIEIWKYVIEKWYKRPILGYGVTGVGFVDSQYARVLGETGLIGFLVFVWLMASIFWEGTRTLNLMKDDWARGLTLGFLAGFIGLLFQAFSASTFIIIRIMEPFWFLTAIVVMLPKIAMFSQKDM